VPDKNWQAPTVLVAVDLVILTLRESVLNVLLVRRGVEPYAGAMALPGGFLYDAAEDLVVAARRELAEEAGLDTATLHLEHLGVYGTPDRDPRGRVISVAYLAIAPGLPEPVAGTDAAGACWTPVDLVLSGDVDVAFDHRRIAADGVEQARAKIEHSALATAFCGHTFTIAELQRVYEAVWGVRLDPRNFYRKVQGVRGFIVADGHRRTATKGRPPRVFHAGPRTVLYPPMVRPQQEGDGSMTDGLVVILTALDLEYDAVRCRLTDLSLHRHQAGTRFEVGRLGDGPGRVALVLVGKGNHPAAVLAERAIAEFAPVAVLFVGVAGALWPSLPLGDLVVATHVYAYHGGTSEDGGMRARPRVWETAHAADQLARHLDRTGEWRRHLPPAANPKVHFGPIAAGEVVQESAVSGHAEWIRQHYNDALAIEMEAAGVAQAGHLNRAPVVIVRGLTDRADGTKRTTDADRWQPRAAANAATFATALAQALIDDSTTLPTATPTSTRRTPMPDITTWNVATGGATVGVQAGEIHGNVHLSQATDPHRPEPSLDLLAQLAALRTHLRHAGQSDQLDEPTRAAANQELDTATAASTSGAPQRWSTMLLALKRLHGLTADVPDLPARITALITLVRGKL
jgi:nucleoside phosphorylase/ADP-ribose pyrophosphatase YjhB (NUDIX family)